MAKNTGSKRSKTQRQLDRATVGRLTLQGWSQSDIAQYLELDQSTISRDLKAIEQQWKQSAVRDFDLDRQAELERLALLEKEHWAAWERSQQGKETSSLEKLVLGKDDAGQLLGRIKQATRSEQRIGDVQFLNGVGKCIEIRAKLLGLFPSEKTGSGSAIAFTDSQIDLLATLMKESRDD